MTESVRFDWKSERHATQFVLTRLEEVVACSPAAQALQDRLYRETGTRLFDWIDHLAFPESDLPASTLYELGFASQDGEHGVVYTHPAAMLPPIVSHTDKSLRLAIKVDSVVDFLAAHRLPLHDEIVGAALSSHRAVRFDEDGDVELWAVERHGDRGFAQPRNPASAESVLTHEETFRLRRRRFENAADGFAHTTNLIRDAATDLDCNRACDLFFAAEREYWQRRNHAARVQKARQDRLGLGWANHDHHTYRSSREHFHRLVAVLEQMGFACRERFYAGREAGWGAQVLEQAACGITVFADVDLAEDEVLGDFAHEPLEPREQLGTVGLWCKLHGEAFLEAGMHHLECQFDFDAAREQLAAEGIDTMAPFTDFPHLRQAFTAGEMWPVDAHRIAAARQNGWIDHAQADRFAAEGALGSHLEILERNDGYKGFNQTGISEIIRKTDPRQQLAVDS
ncbi:MAG: hypothetical protein MI757_10575 [Pirellulales bacterium]|nr:hypothetical protein [Pirellulales bacterium]